MDERPPSNGDRQTTAAAALTGLAVAYPALTAWYFWVDWFRYYHSGVRMVTDAAGFAIPANGSATVISPWRILVAFATSALLATSARRLWQKRPDAPALTLAVLWGVLLPQAFWYTELALDWFRGRHLGAVLAAAIAAVAIPTAMLGRGRSRSALEGWGSLVRSKGRLLAATAALGWLGLAGMTFLDHAFMFADAGSSIAAAMVALPLTALGMVGLWRQRTWGIFAGAAAVASHAVGVVALQGASYAPNGRAMDLLTFGVARHPIAAAMVPAAIFLALLAPFVSGMLRHLVGTPAPPEHAWTGSAARTNTNQRIAVDAQPAPAPTADDDATLEAMEVEASLADQQRSTRGSERG